MISRSPLTERQEEALDHDHSFCVTAGAGTGKTKVLVEKYVDLLASRQGLAVHNILAITFTEKAAAEMKTRIRARLREMTGDKWTEIMQDMVFVEVSTIHSFCAGIVRRFPIEAGVMPGFEILDEQGTDTLRTEAWDDLLYSEPHDSASDALVRVLAVLDQNGTRNALMRFLGRRRASEHFFKSLDAEDESVMASWRVMGEEKQREIIAVLLADEDFVGAINTLVDLASRYSGTEDRGIQYLRDAEDALSRLRTSASVEEQVQLLTELSSTKGSRNMGSKKNWDDADLQNLRESYSYLRSKLDMVVPVLDLGMDDLEFMGLTLRFLRDLSKVFTRFRDIYDNLKRESGVLGFDDLLMTALKLFEECPDAFEYFSQKYRYVLVDEFQDTDPVQFDIVWRILGKVSGQCDKLFVVGDPKQSIYLFRDADVTLFKKTRDMILEDLDGKTMYLDVNFRSVPEIVEFVNHLFSGLLASSEKPWEFGYERIETSEGRSKDEGTVELLLTTPSGPNEHVACSEAMAIADKVQSIVEIQKRNVYWDGKEHLGTPRPARYGDIAILLRRRTNLRYYEWALARKGIPYHVHGGQGFYERQEIKDIYNLLSFLENDHDDAALYGALRSPYFGISDAHLFRSCSHSGGTYWRKLQFYAAQAKDSSVDFGVRKLVEWRSLAHAETVSDLLKRILSESGVLAVYGAMPQGDQIIANIEKLAALARDQGNVGRSSLTDFLSLLQVLIDETPREGEAQLDIESGDNVKIMTIHSAKGLEFPIVIVPDIGARPKESEDSVLIDERYGIGLKLPRERKDFEMSNTMHRALIMPELKDKSIAEEKRLFYVACTRAQDHLVLAGTRPEDVEKSRVDPKSWMDWLFSWLRLDEKHIQKGSMEVEASGAKSGKILLRISQSSVDTWQRGPALREKPTTDSSEDVHAMLLPETIGPITVSQEERSFFPTEIEDYLRCPQMYHRIHVVGIRERPIPDSTKQISALARGQFVHEVLAGRPMELMANLGGIDHRCSDMKSFATIKERFMQLEIMADVVEEYRELPFKSKIGDVWFEGRVDRLVRKADGSWIVIDYKSDDIAHDEVESVVKDYGLQLMVYEKAIGQIVGSNVNSYCYFTGPSVLKERIGDSDQMVSLILDIVGKIKDGTFSYPQCSSCKRKHVPFGLRGTCPALV